MLLGGVAPVLVGIGLLVLVMMWAAGVFRQKIPPGEVPAAAEEGPPADTPFATAVVEERVQDYTEEAIGSLRAASQSRVASQVLARVNEVYVQAGSMVKQGQVLIELDRQALETQLSQAEAGLTAASAALIQAEDDLRREEALAKRGATTEQAVNRARSNRDVARANKEQAEKAVAQAKVMVSYATIRAPTDGMVIEKLVQKGEMARPGEPLLILHDPATFRLEVPVREELAARIAVGTPLKVRVDPLGRTFEGSVDEWVRQADLASRSILVKVKLPPDKDLVEGMTGRLIIPTGQRRHLCLPKAAIRQIGDLDFVQVIHRDPTTGRSWLERRFVRTGREGRIDHIEVLSGVEAGEEVALWPSPGSNVPGKGGLDQP